MCSLNRCDCHLCFPVSRCWHFRVYVRVAVGKSSVLGRSWLLSKTIKMPQLWHVLSIFMLDLCSVFFSATFLFFGEIFEFFLSANICSIIFDMFSVSFKAFSPPVSNDFIYRVFSGLVNWHSMFAADKRVSTIYPWLRNVSIHFILNTIFIFRFYVSNHFNWIFNI